MDLTRREVKIAVIGAGRWGPNLIRNFSEHPKSRVRWVVDRSDERLAQVAARYPDVQLASDASAALDDPAVDAVVIATPATTHAVLALAAIERGKHVFVEKPLAPSLEAARSICEAADAAGRTLAVGHVFLYNAAVQRVKQYLQDDAIGDVRYISAVRTNLGPPGIDVNVAWDLASHDISIANYWLGSTPVAASAVGGSWINGELEDTIFATLRYPSGCLLHLNVSWLNPVKTRAITVVGDRKMATVDDMNLEEPVRLYDKGIDADDDAFLDTFGAFRARIREGDVTIPRLAPSEPLRSECAAFVEASLGGPPPSADGQSALPVVAAVEAINRSLRGGGLAEEITW